MNDTFEWEQLSADWQSLEIDTVTGASVINSVRRRARFMFLGLAAEFTGLIVILGLLVFLLGFLPATSMMIVWAMFGLVVSLISVVFRVRNSLGLWRVSTDSTREMLRLAYRRLIAIEKTGRFNRRLTVIFSIALPLWTALVWWREPSVLTSNPVISLAVFLFAVVWISGYWVINGKTLKRTSAQLEAIRKMQQEFSDQEPAAPG
jgi:hypothetical protein